MEVPRLFFAYAMNNFSYSVEVQRIENIIEINSTNDTLHKQKNSRNLKLLLKHYRDLQ